MLNFFLNITAALLVLCLNDSCSNKSGSGPDPNPPNTTQFAKGADVGWLTEMEAAGRKFYNSSGTEQECMSLLKSLGMNTIRLRVWVNPCLLYTSPSPRD